MCFHSSLNQCTQKMSFLSLPRIQEESSQCPLEFCNSCRRIKRFLYSFSGSFASKFEMTQILFVPRSCGLSFASRFTGCWLWFHDSLCTSLEILSLVLPVRFFFYSWWAPIAWNSFYKPAFDRLLPMEIVLLSGVLRSRRSTVQDATRRKSSQSLE